MSEIKLKPCPFCGGVPFICEAKKHKSRMLGQEIEYGDGAFVECSKCTCAISADTMEDAINTWNTRKPVEKVLEQLEERQKLYKEAWRNTDWVPDKTVYINMTRGFEQAIKIIKEGMCYR